MSQEEAKKKQHHEGPHTTDHVLFFSHYSNPANTHCGPETPGTSSNPDPDHDGDNDTPSGGAPAPAGP